MATSVLLASLSAFGFYALHAVSSTNGLYETTDQYANLRLIPNTSLPWPKWLSLPVPHATFPLPGALLGFFWPCVEPQSTAVALSGLIFAGQAVAAITVLMIEAYRVGNRGKLNSYTTLYAQLMQFSGFGFLAPLFLLLHHLTAVVEPDPLALTIDDRHVVDLKVLPIAMITGFVVPTVLMALPFPGVLSLDAKVAFILLWQIFPVLVYISGQVWKVVLQAMGLVARSGSEQGRGSQKKTGLQDTRREKLGDLRFVYAFALGLSAIAHVAVVGISVLGLIAPGLFASSTAARSISPAELFVPNLSPMTRKIGSLADGSLNFLQWDYAIGSLAHLVWAVTVTAPTRREMSRKVGRMSDFSLGNFGLDIALRSLLLGPLATSLTLMWERDEAVLGLSLQGKDKTN